MRPRGLKCVLFCRSDTGVVGWNSLRSIVRFVFVGVLLYRYRFCEGLVPLTVVLQMANQLFICLQNGRPWAEFACRRLWMDGYEIRCDKSSS